MIIIQNKQIILQQYLASTTNTFSSSNQVVSFPINNAFGINPLCKKVIEIGIDIKSISELPNAKVIMKLITVDREWVKYCRICLRFKI